MNNGDWPTCSWICIRWCYELCGLKCWSGRLYRFWIWWWWKNGVTALTFRKFTAIYTINQLHHKQIAKCIQCQFVETNSHDYVMVLRLFWNVKVLVVCTDTYRHTDVFPFEILHFRFNSLFLCFDYKQHFPSRTRTLFSPSPFIRTKFIYFAVITYHLSLILSSLLCCDDSITHVYE